jgi:hypothetical protein
MAHFDSLAVSSTKPNSEKLIPRYQTKHFLSVASSVLHRLSSDPSPSRLLQHYPPSLISQN